MEPHYTARTAICAECDRRFHQKHDYQSFCSRRCAASRNAPRRASLVSHHDVPLSTGTKGALAEMRVATDLMARGLHVFRAVSPACPCDLIVMLLSGRTIRIEVKTIQVDRRSGKAYFQKAANDQFDVICHVDENNLIYVPPVADWMET